MSSYPDAGETPSLSGRVALVTGAAGGIGSAVGRTFIAAGATVILHDVNAGAVAARAAELGPNASSVSSDLGDPLAVQALWSSAFDMHGRIDVLVNNASTFLDASLELGLDDWVDAWNRTLAVNLVAPAILCRAAIRSYASQPDGGIIINVASVTAHRGANPDRWPYGAAKGGIASMTKTIARFYGRQGVTAFAVAPGFVDTPMSRSILDDDGLRAAAAMTGLGELTQPQDVADVIALLATGRARHATGTTIDVNAAGYCR